MIGLFKALFSSSNFVGAIENVALEAIETDKESAEAKALWIKTLDPNGVMRRELSSFACKAYGFYLVATVLLIFIYASFGIYAGDEITSDITAQKEAIAEAVAAMKDLFLPITGSWAAIVSASFGVNGMNTWKGK